MNCPVSFRLTAILTLVILLFVGGINSAAGYRPPDDSLLFVGNDLYGHINGGAELFHEFGFVQLVVKRFGAAEQEIDVELYEMTGPTAALGIYLAKCGLEKPVEEVPGRNTGGSMQITALRGRHFVQINNFFGDESLQPEMIALAVQELGDIPDEKSLSPLDLLPEADRIAGSERLIRGPYSLQSVYTFGPDDVLLLGGKVFGAVADFAIDSTASFTRILIPYPTAEVATRAFNHLLRNLDHYLKVLDRSDSAVSFVDYQNLYGIVRLAEKSLDIEVNLPQQPAELTAPQ